MTTAALLTAAWIISGTLATLGLCALIGANDSVTRATRYADKQKARADHWEAAYRDATKGGNVRSIREAPAFERIANTLAANEAARADWEEIRRWTS